MSPETPMELSSKAQVTSGCVARPHGRQILIVSLHTWFPRFRLGDTHGAGETPRVGSLRDKGGNKRTSTVLLG